MTKKILEKILVLSATLMLCILLLEIGLRVKDRKSFRISQGEYVQHGSTYRLRKNSTTFHDWSTSTFTVNTNSLGTRDRTTGKKDIGSRPYVIFLGDSQVFGLGVDYEKSFVGIFADYAAGRGVEVLNFAVGGHFLLEQEELFRDMMEKLPGRPSVVFFTVNPRSLNWFERVHEGTVVKSGYLFHESTWKSAYVRMMLQNNLSIYVFFRDVFWGLKRSWVGTDGTVRLPKHFDLYSGKSKLYDAETASRLEDHISRFQSYCDELGIRAVYLNVPICDSFTINKVVTSLGKDPGDYDIYLYEKFMEDYCAKHGHLFLNPKPVLKEYYDQGEEMDFGRDPHYNEFSNRTMGEFIVEKVFVENELF